MGTNPTRMGNLLKTFDPPEVSVVEDIFRYQKSFASKFIPFDDILNQNARGQYNEFYHWVNELVLCCMSELSEVLDWLPWKHWKNYKSLEVDLSEIRFELIDLLHFLTNLCLLRGVPPTVWMTKVEARGEVQADLVDALKKWLPAMQMAVMGIYKYPLDKTCYEAAMYVLREGFVLLDMSTEDIWNYYRSKNEENFDRQVRGY